MKVACLPAVVLCLGRLPGCCSGREAWPLGSGIPHRLLATGRPARRRRALDRAFRRHADRHGRVCSAEKTYFFEYLRFETRSDGIFYVALPVARSSKVRFRGSCGFSRKVLSSAWAEARAPRSTRNSATSHEPTRSRRSSLLEPPATEKTRLCAVTQNGALVCRCRHVGVLQSSLR